MRIVCISDTHGQHKGLELPDGDVLIHAGDYTASGTIRQRDEFYEWFAGLPGFSRKVLVSGNHDFQDQEDPPPYFTGKANGEFFHLNNHTMTYEGVRFYGSPWAPRFGDWAFMYDREDAYWGHIPETTDVLITHGPPAGVLDKPYGQGLGVGCEALRETLHGLEELKLHVFGHIHGSYGQLNLGPTFVNASVVDERYRRVNAPVVVDI